MTYSQMLRDPRWQKLRLKVFERDGWKCQRPGWQSAENTPLAVHHKDCLAGRDPWDYPLTNLETLCEKYHERAHDTVAAVERSLEEGGIYAWDERLGLLGFEPYKYLTERNGRVVCACIRLGYNPDAPDILLPDNTSEIMAKSRKFIGQEEFIPVFITGLDAGWECCGRWRVEAATANAVEVNIQ